MKRLSRKFMGPWIAVVGLVLAGQAFASHPPLIGTISEGIVLTRDGPVLASIAFRPCEGPITVRVVLQLSTGPTVDEFPAFLDIIAPEAECLAGVPIGPPAAHFRITGENGAARLDGLYADGGHFTAWNVLAGDYRENPSLFGILAA